MSLIGNYSTYYVKCSPGTSYDVEIVTARPGTMAIFTAKIGSWSTTLGACHAAQSATMSVTVKWSPEINVKGADESLDG